ncbi:hypothetical protein ANN_10059 [Periplaneta americana]|uniref:Per a allergen n=1 Tax=Periplaneta americana TaxID=6978 RepID=A0ABQ8TNA8_PERAM|nr:hypothetical protein ANN_10059 [Periplaneta americana]
MAGLCEGGNEPAGSLKAICKSSIVIVQKELHSRAVVTKSAALTKHCVHSRALTSQRAQASTEANCSRILIVSSKESLAQSARVDRHCSRVYVAGDLRLGQANPLRYAKGCSVRKLANRGVVSSSFGVRTVDAFLLNSSQNLRGVRGCRKPLQRQSFDPPLWTFK